MCGQSLKLRRGEQVARETDGRLTLLGAVLNSSPVSLEISSAILTSNPRFVFNPWSFDKFGIMGCCKYPHSSNSSSTLCEQTQSWENILNSRNSVGQLLNITAEFLAQSERRCVLQVCSANLDDVVKFFGFGVHSVSQLCQCRDERVGDFHNSSHVHRSGKARIFSQQTHRWQMAYTDVSLLLWLMLT